MSYIEALCAEYHTMSPATAFHETGMPLGHALLEARASRLGLGGMDYIDRAMVTAAARCRRQIRQNFTIEEK